MCVRERVPSTSRRVAAESGRGRDARSAARRRRTKEAVGAVVLAAVVVAVAARADIAWAAEGGIEEVKSFATKLTNYVTAIAASVAVLFMAISGVRWTMSSGNPMRQTEARNGLVAAASGLAIALSANVIVTLVVSALK